MKRKHLVIMLLCCLVPVIGLAVVWYFKVPIGTVGTIGLLLLCPIGHLVMMKFMGGHDHGDHQPQTGSGQSTGTPRPSGKELE